MADLSKTEKLINDVLRQDAEFAITPLRAGRYVSAACYVEREADPGKGQTESIIKMIYDLAIENNNRGQAEFISNRFPFVLNRSTDNGKI